MDAIILAAAGVKSLKLEKKISLTFETHQLLPAAGQGVIAVQCRKKDESVLQNLILTGFKICKSCRVSKTIFPL